MASWSTYSDIVDAVKKKWKNGDILRECITNNDLFPLSIKLKIPTKNEIMNNLLEAREWKTNLKKNEKSTKNFGYELIIHEFNYREIGKTELPTHAVIPSLEDAVKLMKKESSIKLFNFNVNSLTNKWPMLIDWIIKYPHKVIDKIGQNLDKFESIVAWFENNPDKYIYVREISIKRIDSKFIENNKTLIEELLLYVLPEERIESDAKGFEEKFKLKRKPMMIRFRVLDSSRIENQFSDITVSINEFKNWNPGYKKVFVTENEINFLSFPNVDNACIIFGKGYEVGIFSDIKWLKDKEVYYWGDIDTHGFNILSRARSHIPNIKSFLMTEDIFREHKEFWVTEEKQFTSVIQHLTPHENEMVEILQNNVLGNKLRLEQERIRFDLVVEYLSCLE